ncbi:protein FAR1-RELATED SEQUENCE 12-like isoform X2 [Juglans regia]|uniref:Protein FAR1-RELATED SEQUENCE 12-like isoform X2 n=1 Tax=Juglans regia TaxID=51240 RepID=A0A2I4FBJ8_JUGRE|nr:protein FAR1-RELATED SEQUENCE 12-like isoform X2 [Juglans regia]
MDSELVVGIDDGEFDNSTDIELELCNDVTVIRHSVEETSFTDQNDKISHGSSMEEITIFEGGEPYVGQEFESEEGAHAFYSAYGMRVGFVTRINYLSRSKLDGSIIGRTLVCNKEGYRKPYRIDKKNSKPRIATRVGCKAMLSVRKLSTEKWVVTKFVKEHTHALTAGNAQNILTNTQIPNENVKIQELTQQLLLERKRSASLRKVIDLLFSHIEQHAEDLSRRVQHVADQVKEIESGRKTPQNCR